MKKITAIMIALMMVVGLTQCKKQVENNENNQDIPKVMVSCVIPINNGGKTEFTNVMTNGTVKWSVGTERIYIAIPDETNPQIVEMTAHTTVESNILCFEGEVTEGLLKNGQYEVWYFGNSKESGNSYITEEIEDNVIKSISGSIASQSGDLGDLGYCHIAKTTVTAETNGEKVVLSMNGTLKNYIAIAHLDLEGITQLKGDAIVGTEYTLKYNDGAFEFVVTPNATANITVTDGTTASYVVLLPNATANVDLKSNTSKKVTFEGGVEANKIYRKFISDMEYKPLIWEDYEEMINGHAYVDLGLPSGLLWATCNVGANAPEEYGDYFAWGKTSTNENYIGQYCPTYELSYHELFSQGYINSKGHLKAQYDAATANWGGDWRMPTYNELDELIKECTWTWTTQNGVNGYKVTSKTNDNYIFLPAAGSRSGWDLNSTGSLGYYWSSEPLKGNIYDYEYKTYCLHYSSDEHSIYFDKYRYNGQSVRPVCKGSSVEPDDPSMPNANGYEYVDLGLSVKWASCNLGANEPEEYGNYYAWGETKTKSEYNDSNCPTYGLTNSQLISQKYIDSNDNLRAEHDAATANWGGDWRMPTKAEYHELLENCTWTWTTKNSVNGYIVEGPNGNCIFLPAAGTRTGSSLYNNEASGNYWTSTTYRSYSFIDSGFKFAYHLLFNNKLHNLSYISNRYIGQSVRPVIK